MNSGSKALLAFITVVAIVFMFPSFRPFFLLTRLVTVANLHSMSMSATPFSMVFVTAPNQEVAKKIAGGLGKNHRAVLNHAVS
jgi:hypothetical protein